MVANGLVIKQGAEMKKTGKVDIKKVRKALSIARNSKDIDLKKMLGGLMDSNSANRSLANRIVHPSK